ncbi:MAG TPA: YceI family protein [Burkholderiaceae bacterium]
MNTSRFLQGLALAALVSTTAHAVPLKTDAAKSTVSATFKQMNVPVDTKFKKFAAQIDYDAAKPANSKASLDVDVASFDLGDPEYNQEVVKKEWFNGAQFPKASFVSSGMTGDASKLNVTGKLTIKGKATDVSFPITVKKDGNAMVFDGNLPIKRLTYNVGEGEWKDTSTVADEVTIKFHIVANP